MRRIDSVAMTEKVEVSSFQVVINLMDGKQ